jgi:hypothetical protein
VLLHEGSSSFLKKRTKKLLPVWAEPVRRVGSQTIKSFLLLFFKKEVLPSLTQTTQTQAPDAAEPAGSARAYAAQSSSS